LFGICLILLRDPLYFVFVIFLYAFQLAPVVVALGSLVEGGRVLLVNTSETLSQSVTMMVTMMVMVMVTMMVMMMVTSRQRWW
jgi:uncharacterized protein HemY